MNQAPASPGSGVIYGIEDDRWIVTLVGYNGCFPPTDEAGFLEFARNLAKPAIYEQLKEAEALTTIHGYRRTENRLRHFDKLRRWPTGFIVLGDACCTLNPVYGQGMTLASISVSVLDKLLTENPPAKRLPKLFQRRLKAALKSPFTTATSDDLRWPETTGRAPPGLRLLHKFIDRVMSAATTDPKIHLRLMEVLHMIRPTSALARPRIVRRALRTRE
ncbi:MAG TPA: hypothetical protein ENK31_09060 [Nannocystis exedens]|nr:hypothetical protein [Nannocystis exedens]